MLRHSRALVRSIALAAAPLFPAVALAETGGYPSAEAFSLTTFRAGQGEATLAGPSKSAPADGRALYGYRVDPSRPIYMADAPPAEEQPNIHGFVSVPFKTSYVTPRGLVVDNAGVIIQPIVGLVIPIDDLGPFKDVAVKTGIWNSFNSKQGDPQVGPWNEMDYFLTFAGRVGDFTAALSYGAWMFPQSTENKPDTEHNVDLRIGYDDTKLWGGGFGLFPYADIFWAVSGSSTVVLGRGGDTGYLELGIVPRYVLKGAGPSPITLEMPIYFSVGPENYWDAAGDHGHFGVGSASINATMPLDFIPARYGRWNVNAGVSYYYLFNGSLVDAGTILSGNDSRHVVQGSLGIGMSF